MQKLMILGAGIYQVPLIKKAQAMGLETIVVSYPGPYPGLDVADRALLLDTTDAAGVLDAARRERIDGIVTTGTDVAVRTIGVVCDALGLPGVSEQCALSLTDKATMKAMFKRGGVPTAPFEEVRSLEETRAAAELIGFPVMVKACDVSGSRGITKVEDAHGIDNAYLAAMGATHTDHLVVEGFVEGHEIGIDGFVLDGKLALFAPHGKFTYTIGGVTVPAGHSFPLHASQAVLDRAQDAIERAIAASGLATGAFNSDVMITPEGEVSILEMGARCGATGIPELITMYTGIDYYEQIIRASLGLPLSLAVQDAPVPCMSKLLFSRRSALVEDVDLESVKALENRYRALITIDVAPGDQVHAAHDGTDRYGSIVMPASSEQEIDEALEELRGCIKLGAAAPCIP